MLRMILHDPAEMHFELVLLMAAVDRVALSRDPDGSALCTCRNCLLAAVVRVASCCAKMHFRVVLVGVAADRAEHTPTRVSRSPLGDTMQIFSLGLCY
jgi:hypothetical protein